MTGVPLSPSPLSGCQVLPSRSWSTRMETGCGLRGQEEGGQLGGGVQVPSAGVPPCSPTAPGLQAGKGAGPGGKLRTPSDAGETAPGALPTPALPGSPSHPFSR